METINVQRYDSREQVPLGGEGMVPCPTGCGGWTLVKGSRIPLVFPCLACRRHIMPEVEEKPTELRGSLEVGNDGRTYFRFDKTAIAPWKRLNLPVEYANLTLMDPEKIGDRRYAKNKFAPVEFRRPGVTYITSDVGWSAVSALQALIRGESVPAVGLFGNNGTGKSRLLYATAQDLVRAGRSVYILDGEKLHHDLMSDGEDMKARGRSMVQYAVDADVLLWDELGYCGSHTKEWLHDDVLSEITHIVYRRERGNKTTVFTANAIESGIKKRLGAPVWSRIEGMCGKHFYWLVGPDDFNYRANGKAPIQLEANKSNVLPLRP